MLAVFDGWLCNYLTYDTALAFGVPYDFWGGESSQLIRLRDMFAVP